MTGVRTALAPLRDSIRSRLWPLPTVAVVLAVALGVFLPHLDDQLDGGLPGWLAGIAFRGDADAARTVLDAVASSLITVTALTFSLTVVTLQLASSQFSPRLLRTFTRDLFVQSTLGVFLATFSYSLTVLRSVRGGTDDPELVPRLSVSFAFVLAVASVVMLVVFLAHLVTQIRVETMLREVHEDASDLIGQLFSARRPAGTPIGSDRSDPAVPQRPPGAATLLAPRSGFLVRIDEQRLLEACTDRDAVCVIDRHVGSHVVKGTPIGWLWSPGGPKDGDGDSDPARLAKALTIGFERTSVQDLGYGLRQLTDVANKALSPGINDPTTAVHALGHISALLCDLAEVEPGPVVLTDDDDRVRVVVHRPDLAELVDGAITQPRRYGASDPHVMLRLFQLLAELAWRCPESERGCVVDQLRRLVDTVDAQDFDDHERRTLQDAADIVRRALRTPTS